MTKKKSTDNPETPKNQENLLVGYIRKSNRGQAIKLSLAADAFDAAERYTGQDGTEYVGLVASLDRVMEVISGERDVTSVSQLSS